MNSENNNNIKIAVLALQGGFKEHVDMINSLSTDFKSSNNVNIQVKEIKSYEQITEFKPDGVILPGGESTSMSIIASSNKGGNIFDYLKQFVESGKPVWGTCAGSIMLSNKVDGQKVGGQSLIGGLDVLISRNYFGRQINSFIRKVDLKLIHEQDTDKHQSIVDDNEKEITTTEILKDFEAVFIRAPAILKVLDKDKVSIIAEIQGKPLHDGATQETHEKVIIGVRQSNIIATVFHPELTNDNRFHKYFIDIVVNHYKTK